MNFRTIFRSGLVGKLTEIEGEKGRTGSQKMDRRGGTENENVLPGYIKIGVEQELNLSWKRGKREEKETKKRGEREEKRRKEDGGIAE